MCLCWTTDLRIRENHMPIEACRVCGEEIYREPLLRYENMPKGAQQFLAVGSDREPGIELVVCQCSGCGLVQLSNDAVPYYREVVRAAGSSDVIKEAKTRQFYEFIRKYSLEDKRIIEIGCGRGEFLSLLQALRVQAYGLEYSEAAVRVCVEGGLKVTRGYVESASTRLENGPFDGFLLLMFLEHMPDPKGTLRGIYSNVREGGIGLIEVPNFDMLLRNKLFSEFVADHLLYFSTDTLRTTLGLSGFEFIECSELRDGYVLSAVVQKRRRLDLTEFDINQKAIEAEIDAYVGRFGERKVAIWGAGHQAQTIIILAKIADKIRYVVDSALFKQGKCIPGTRVPIVSPDTLRSDPVEAILVVAGSYSDEVAGILLERFDGHMSVAILRNQALEVIR